MAQPRVTHSGNYFFVADRLIFDRLHATLHVRSSVAFYLRFGHSPRSTKLFRFNEKKLLRSKSVNVLFGERRIEMNDYVPRFLAK